MKLQFSNTIQQLKTSATREILKLTQGNDIISFAGGLPAEDFFPDHAMKEAFNKVFDQGKKSLQYGITEGHIPLRKQICQRMKKKGMVVNEDQIQITTGSQQAIDLITRIFINPGDTILVENPTYLAALQVFEGYGAKVVGVKSDDDGIHLNDLKEKITRHRPKFIYVTPTFANPTGRFWSNERKQGILNICKQHETIIIEDDPYGEIQFNETSGIPSIYSLNNESDEFNPVIYTSTFSKTVIPALRIGWVVGESSIIQQITKAKQAADLHSSMVDQQALYFLLRDFDLDQHILNVSHEYEQRKNLMTQLLLQYEIPAKWVDPQGGMFLWLTLNDSSIDATELLKKAVKEGVAFVPGSVFYTGETLKNTMRLNFTYTAKEQMEVGIKRLQRVFTTVPQN
ncbi:aminotransferase-like domain-containing protein [Chengkuizengella axinellae]|uniref:PLP-dependent aminotransferase family protein n=1 Tax=Chengkuizengella axinellae TaxID=3064388 RepID=A0ABT9IUH3_9BACL|nr:PLP-dependent aminotransferase family protein [Chengkuizengella sp. 2205SS18-9]MDP5273010.1 PLP-dependent aminotransferase family protein [Chengkuizengella sp. 2205SS18-9]